MCLQNWRMVSYIYEQFKSIVQHLVSPMSRPPHKYVCQRHGVEFRKMVRGKRNLSRLLQRGLTLCSSAPPETGMLRTVTRRRRRRTRARAVSMNQIHTLCLKSELVTRSSDPKYSQIRLTLSVFKREKLGIQQHSKPNLKPIIVREYALNRAVLF
jgi:hypothetical protein